MADENRLRGMLEVATAVLLGLVSVATAAGAYQASEWSQQSSAYAATAGQLRDASLSTHIESQLGAFDDGERIFEVLNLEFDIIGGATNVDEIRETQETVLRGGSPGLLEEWTTWVANGYPQDALPMQGHAFTAAQVAPTYGANQASAVAYRLSDEIGARSMLITVASAVFALALLLLGVSGANASIKVAFGLVLGGTGVFVVGVVISLFAVVG